MSQHFDEWLGGLYICIYALYAPVTMYVYCVCSTVGFKNNFSRLADQNDGFARTQRARCLKSECRSLGCAARFFRRFVLFGYTYI